MTDAEKQEYSAELLATPAGRRKVVADLLIIGREEGYGAGTIWDAYNNRGYRDALDVVYGLLETGHSTPELLVPAVGANAETAEFLGGDKRQPRHYTVCQDFRQKGFMEGVSNVRRAISEFGLSADEIRAAIEQYRAGDRERKIAEEAAIKFSNTALAVNPYLKSFLY